MITHALVADAAAHVLGMLVSRWSLAIAVGVYSAVKQYSVGDYVVHRASRTSGSRCPTFWFGLLAIALLVTVADRSGSTSTQPIFYSVGLHSDGQSGFNLDYLRHLALPVLTLTVQSVAAWSRFQRASMLDVLNADYIRTARAKGVPQRQGDLQARVPQRADPARHGRSRSTPRSSFGGLIITEQIFSIPGMGRLFLDALQAGDAPVLLGVVPRRRGRS